jgi:segregation and condensation protein B
LENPKNQTTEPNQTPEPLKTKATTETAAPEVEEAQESPAQAGQRKTRALALLEAALYIAGRPLNINELGQVLNSRSKKRVQTYLEELMKEYQNSRALEIISLKDERYVLQVKAEYTPLIKKLVNRPLLSSGPLKTLSYIAYRQPITQKRVIQVRGQHAYGHVKMLKDMGLIVTERSGRSLALKTTDYFADYFGLTQDMTTLKRDLRKVFGDAIKEDAAERQRKEAEEEKQAIQDVEAQPENSET